MAILLVTYTLVQEVEVDIPDYTFTAEQLQEKASKIADDYSPMCPDELHWEWVKEPKAAGSQVDPPEDFWMQCGEYEFANNGYIVLEKKCPIRPDFKRDWMHPSKTKKEVFIELASKDFALMPLHQGWFIRSHLQPFLALDGIKVVGSDSKQLAYILQHGKLIAMVCPLSRKTDEAIKPNKSARNSSKKMTR